MGFNFGAFAGGLATAIQTQQKLNLEEKKYDDDIKASNAKLKQEENKALAEILKQVDEHNKNVSNLSLGMSKAEDETQYNTYVSELKAANENFKANAKSQLDNYANTPLGQKMETLFNGARISDVEQVEKTTIKDANSNVVETYIPQSLVQDKDNLVLMENGRFGIAQVGQDGKISGYQPTNIAPIKFKTPEGKSSFGVINGKEGFYTNEQLANATAQGMRVERSKDKPAVTNITVEAQKQQTIDSAFQYIEDIKSDPTKFNKATANKLEAQVMSTDYGKSDSVKQLRNDANNLERSVKSIERLKEDIQSKVDSKQFQNQYETFAKELVVKFAPENWEVLSSEEKNKYYDYLKTKGAMGDALAQYLRSNSGTAASEKEAIRNITNMFGSGSQFASIGSINAALDGFLDTKKKALVDIGTQALDNGLPATGGRIISEYGMKPVAKAETQKTQPKQVGLAGNLPVMQDEKGEYVEINGVKKYKGVK